MRGTIVIALGRGRLCCLRHAGYWFGAWLRCGHLCFGCRAGGRWRCERNISVLMQDVIEDLKVSRRINRNAVVLRVIMRPSQNVGTRERIRTFTQEGPLRHITTVRQVRADRMQSRLIVSGAIGASGPPLASRRNDNTRRRRRFSYCRCPGIEFIGKVTGRINVRFRG
jgi:hypothetical protein